MSANVVDNTGNVKKAARNGSIKSVGRAAATIWGIARRSIATPAKPRKLKSGKMSTPKALTPSAPGKPPRSPTGRLKSSIAFNVDKTTGRAVIGPARSAIARIGHTHEFSGKEPPKNTKRQKGKPTSRQYPARPFMGPALRRSQDRLPSFWRNSLRS